MTSPAVDLETLDLRGTIDRLERELARVIREKEIYRDTCKAVQERCTELLEEVRALKGELFACEISIGVLMAKAGESL